MRRFSRLLLLSALLITAGSAHAGGCKAGLGCGGGGAWAGCGPYWCDPFVDFSPWPNDNYLYDGPRNWAWRFPHGGFTVYPGEPGSGIKMGSDYSHINWVVPPADNAKMVLEKLKALGVPLVPQETIYLGKNPGAVQKAKLPLPKSWIKDDEKEPEKEPGKAKDPDKDN